MRTQRGLVRFGSLFLVSAISLLLAEFLFRQVLVSEWEAATTEIEHPYLEYVPNAPYFYRLKANCVANPRIRQADGSSVEWQIRTNSEGLRGPDLEPEGVGDEVEKILFLGDSYTFGYAIPAEDAFPAMTGVAQEAAGRPTLAINAGVPGYNSEQESHLLRELLDRFAVDRVVLSYVINDAEPAPNFPLHPETRFEDCPIWIWERSKPAANLLARALVGDRELFRRQELMPNPDPLTGFAPERREWQDSRRAIAAMATLCKERQIPLLLVIMPSFIMMLDDSYPYTLIHDRVRAWCGELNIPVLDLLPLFHRMDVYELSIPGDGHPNEKAHAMIAGAIVKELAAGR